MFEVLGFIAAFIVGLALTAIGTVGVFMKYGFSGNYDGETAAFTLIHMVGIVIIVLALQNAPFTITLT